MPLDASLAPCADAPAVRPSGDFVAAIPPGWRTELGDVLPDRVVRCRLVGARNGPVVAVLGGVSADRFAAAAPGGRPGWWADVVRPGGGVDPTRFGVLGVDFAPLAPETALAFRPADQARLLALAMDAAGIERLAGLVGASYGGMVALAFARLFPHRVDRLAVISAAARPHPMATAWRGVQRRILAFAEECGRGAEGVALARQLAMTTYRSPEEFAERFAPGLPGAADAGEVCGYLQARGAAYVEAMPPARFATLSAAIDRHDEDPAAITTPTLLVAASTDRLIPVEDMRALAAQLAGPSRLVVIPSPYGHDAFLKEAAALRGPLRAFLGEGA